jgi:L-alanine-DL-glutamate epimerase-like enolase superfamily enzyme
MRQRVAEHRERGYRGHSIKIGALNSEGGPALDAARIEECLADRQPGEYFLADANGGMSVESALRLINLLPEKIDFVFEAPCATWRECVSFKLQCRLPIIWDELAITDDNVMQMISENASDGISIKISKNGGLTHCRRQRDFCVTAGYTMNVQETVGTDIAYAAILHLAQSIPERYLTCISKTSDLVTTKVADFDIPLIDGGVEAPMKPGLGIAPNIEVFGSPIATWA